MLTQCYRRYTFVNHFVSKCLSIITMMMSLRTCCRHWLTFTCTNVLFQEKVWSDTDTEIHIEIEEGEWYLKPSNLLNSLLINFSL